MQTETTKQIKRKRWLRIGLINMILVLLILLTAAIVFNSVVPSSKNIHPDAVFVITQNKGYPALAPQSANDQTLTRSSFFTAFDEDKIWSTSETINLFEHNDPNVGSDGTGSAAHVIAPGTRNNYIFCLENDQRFNVKYHLELIAEDNNDTPLPVYVNIVGPDGRPLTGGNAFMLSKLPVILHDGILKGYQYVNFTINWAWGFENGSDEYDTMLGNMAADKELACGFHINVVAEQTDEDETSRPEQSSGEISKPAQESFDDRSVPQQESISTPEASDQVLTGDKTNPKPFNLIIIFSAVVILILLLLPVLHRKRR